MCQAILFLKGPKQDQNPWPPRAYVLVSRNRQRTGEISEIHSMLDGEKCQRKIKQRKEVLGARGYYLKKGVLEGPH